MDLKNKGITWDYYKRYPYAGVKITAENRRAYLEQFAEQYIEGQSIEKRKDPMVIKEAQKYAKDRVNREVKHERAHTAGKNTYTFKGETYSVMDEERFKRFKEQLIQMDLDAQKQKAEKAAEEEE